MNFEIKLYSGKTEYDFKIEDSSIKIVDLLQKIISEMKLEKIPFNLIYKTDIIGSKNNEEILNTFFAEEINIVLTIVKSVKIPKSFNSIEPLIEYINMINTQIDDYLLYLYNIYINYENKSNNNILFHIENINFIIFYHKNTYRLPKNCSRDKIYDNKQFIMYFIDYKINAYYTGTLDNLKDASKKLQDDEEVVMKAVQKCGNELKYASERLQDSEEIVKIAVKQCGYALASASERLQDNEEIVKIAVKRNGNALSSASKRLKDNEEIVMIAIENYKQDRYYTRCNILNYTSDRLKNNIKIIMLAIEKDIRLFKYVTDELKDNKKFILNIINNYTIHYKRIYCCSFGIEYYLLEDVSERLQDDAEIITAAVTNYGYNLKYASERLRDNEEIVRKAFEEDNNAIMFASKELQNNIEFLLSLVGLKKNIKASNLLHFLRLDEYGRDLWDSSPTS
jgi:hypothetical protein